jgi:hypothetical protein
VVKIADTEKLVITAEQIQAGEKLKEELVQRLKHKGLVLQERHENLWSADMPRILSISKGKDYLYLISKLQDKFEVVTTPAGLDVLRAALAVCYGYGFFHYNYDFDFFRTLEDEVKYYEDLAVEVWERNLHLDWMKKCGYKKHNGTKDAEFLSGVVDPNRKSNTIETHRTRTDTREKGDSPHHAFRVLDLFTRVVLSEGDDPYTPFLIESFYDEATIPSRLFHRNTHPHVPFARLLRDNRDAGYYLSRDLPRWTPGVFGLNSDYAHQLMKKWIKVHEEFEKYWLGKFGKNEEHWQPPKKYKK